MNKLITLIALVFTLISCQPAMAEEPEHALDLGLWTYHFDRTVKPWECFNEEHDLVAYRYKNFGVGAYINTHCRQSFLVTNRWNFKDTGFTFDLSIISGYPESMHIIDKYVILPSFGYTKYLGDIGITFIFVPESLVGIGYSYRFEGL